MLGDFRHRADNRSRRLSRDWRAFAAGFLAATLCSGAVWLTLGTRECPELSTSTAPAPLPGGGGEEPVVTAPRPEFTFPQMLEKQEVLVTEVDAQRPPEPAPPTSPVVKDDGKSRPAMPPDGTLVVQVAALRTGADALALKARLGELGLAALVQPTRINNDTVHRVRLGPYGSLAQVKDVQARLKRAGYASIVIREQ